MTRWFRHNYEAEYERYGHPERDDEALAWTVNEVSGDHKDYEPNPTTGYDPVHDKEMRFSAGDWGELIDRPDIRPDPVQTMPQDMAVSDGVCERLCKEPGVDLSKIGVYSEAGVVTLSGSVASIEMKRRLLGVVARVPRVVRVVDRLQVAEHA